jgi:hypothetical protein
MTVACVSVAFSAADPMVDDVSRVTTSRDSSEKPGGNAESRVVVRLSI